MIGLLMLATISGTGFLSGNSFLELCQTNRVACAAYVEGVSDERDALQSTAATSRLMCMPTGVTAGQIADIAIKHFTDHPEIRHLLAADEVAIALIRAFPCPRK